MKRILVGLLLGGGLISVASGQGAQAKPAMSAYDVVSIKTGDPMSQSSRLSVTNARFLATNISARALLSDAYEVKQDAIHELPKALESPRFDMDARVLETDKATLDKMTPQERHAMMRVVLADRFKLVAHKETRTLPIYELVVAPDGLKMKAVGTAGNHNVNIRRRELDSRNTTIAVLADVLSNQLHVPVVDKTALTDAYDMNLKWSLEDDPPAADLAPSIFTALQEQLGLKLRSAKGPVEVLVVDHMEVPSEN